MKGLRREKADAELDEKGQDGKLFHVVGRVGDV